MNIYEKLSMIQNELNVPKKRYSDFGKFFSRNCEDILEAVKPICAKHKTLLLTNSEIITVENRFYVQTIVTLYDLEAEGSSVSAKAQAREDESKPKMDGSQTTGSATSYSKKYALGHLFNIDDNKDSDELEPDQEEDGYKTTDKIDVPRQNLLRKELDRVGGSVEWLCRTYKVPGLDIFTYQQYEDAMAKFKATPDKK